MRRTILVMMILSLSSLSLLAQRAVRLSCNYENSPLAMDDPRPRLSWQLMPGKGQTMQTAYRILVSSSAKALSQDRGEIWDSGRKRSDQSRYIAFAGKPMRSRRLYYWKVKIWDERGWASAWSRTAVWRTGLLHPADWKGHWITASRWYTPPGLRPKGFQLVASGGWADVDLGKSVWIDSLKLYPADHIAFPRRFQILGSEEFNFIHRAVLVDRSATNELPVPALPQLFQIKPAKFRFIRLRVIGDTLQRSTAVRQLEVFSAGRNIALMKFTREYGTAWEHGHAPFLVDGMPSHAEGPSCPADACPSEAAPLFRKTFNAPKRVREALLYVAALGMVDVTVNGHKSGNDVLGPPFTDYSRHVMYSTSDVTTLIHRGENAIGAVLGNGFFSTPSLGFGQRHNGNGPPRFRLQLHLQYDDGSEETIATGPDWKWARGAITLNDIWEGYAEDRRLAKPGWDKPGFQDSAWRPARKINGLGGTMIARYGPPNRVNGLIRPFKVAGNHAYFETASVGWPLLRINGKAGQKITITGNGPGYQMARLSYVLAEDGPAELSPRFIIQPGATDIQVDGLSNPLALADISIQYVNADLEKNGDFHCSNPFLDQLYQVTMRTHRNYVNDFPADPNREKQGWTQDVQNMFRTAAYFTDVRSLYWRWWNDMADNQDAQGYLGSVVPMVNRQVYDWNSPWWSGMIVFLPWEHYLYYGNRQILEKAYPAMKRYVDFLARMAASGEGKNWDDYTYFTQNLDSLAAREKMIIWNGAGDWNNPYTRTQHAVPTPITTMPAWYYFARIISRSATLLNKQQDAVTYGAMAGDIRKRFNRKYYNGQTGLYGDSTNSQTAQVLPLAVGMVPTDGAQITYRRLLDAIHLRNDHVGTGFTSLSFLLQLLAGHRESGLANRMINQQDYPGWKTLIKGGVLQEDWHGDGAQMPSCGGAVGAWLFQSVLGIQPDERHPGFQQFLVSPQPDPATGLTAANGYFDSGYGRISVAWACNQGKFILELKVPPNSSAHLILPADRDPPGVLPAGLRKLRFGQHLVCYFVKAGNYRIETPYNITAGKDR